MQGMAHESNNLGKKHGIAQHREARKTSSNRKHHHKEQSRTSHNNRSDVNHDRKAKERNMVVIEPLDSKRENKPMIILRPASGNSETDVQTQGSNLLKIPTTSNDLKIDNNVEQFVSYSTPVSRRGSYTADQLLPPRSPGRSSSQEKSPAKSCLVRDGSTKFSGSDCQLKPIRRSLSVSFHPDTDFSENRRMKHSHKASSSVDISHKNTSKKDDQLDEKALKILEHNSKITQVLVATKQYLECFKGLFHQNNNIHLKSQASSVKSEQRSSSTERHRHRRRHSKDSKRHQDT